MPDFEQLVRDRLERWQHHEREEVIRELAGHLEDRYEELLRDGLEPREALAAALSEGGDLEELSRAIDLAKRGTMTDRARGIWIPGLIALLITLCGQLLAPRLLFSGPFGLGHWSWLAATLSVPVIAGAAAVACALYFGADLARRVWIPGTIALLVRVTGELLLWQVRVPPQYASIWSWLAILMRILPVLLVAGAAGAACSLFSGGDRRQRVWAAEFPLLFALPLILIRFPWRISLLVMLKHFGGWHFFRGLAFGYLMSPIVYGVILLIGASPFLTGKSRPPEVAMS